MNILMVYNNIYLDIMQGIQLHLYGSITINIVECNCISSSLINTQCISHDILPTGMPCKLFMHILTINRKHIQ